MAATIDRAHALSQWEHGRQPMDSTLLQVDDGGDAPSYPQSDSHPLLPPPDFRPFFTLVEDTDTGEYHHPSVHYIFSDDDPDIMTTSVIDALQDEHDQERFIILDIASDGKTITSAHSLSPVWQISQTSMEQAPSWNESGAEKLTGGLMLRMSGLESSRDAERAERRASHTDTIASMEAVIGGYGSKLAQLEQLLQHTTDEEEEAA